MKLHTISMDRNDARKTFLAYCTAVRGRDDDEDQKIMRGYRELAKGNQLILLNRTIKAGGNLRRSWKMWNGTHGGHYFLFGALPLVRGLQEELELQDADRERRAGGSRVFCRACAESPEVPRRVAPGSDRAKRLDKLLVGA